MMRNCYTCDHFMYKPEPPFIGECHIKPPELVSQPDEYSFIKIKEPSYCAEYRPNTKSDFP